MPSVGRDTEWVRVVNIDDVEHTLRDSSFPGGFAVIKPKKSRLIPSAVYVREFRPQRRWMARAEVCDKAGIEYDVKKTLPQKETEGNEVHKTE